MERAGAVGYKRRVGREFSGGEGKSMFGEASVVDWA